MKNDLYAAIESYFGISDYIGNFNGYIIGIIDDCCTGVWY
ncbi:MAG: hypothetical protein ACJA19_000846 [Bacteroidia bacterium]